MTADTVETPPPVNPEGEAAARQEQPPKPKGVDGLKGVVSDNRTVWMPWGWMAAADVAAVTTHYATPNLGWAVLTAAGTSAVAVGWTAWLCREARLAGRIKLLKTRRKVQANAKTAVIAGSLWELTTSLWTPFGPHGMMQLVLVGGGLAVAAPHWWRTRRREVDEPVREIEPPREDARLTRFRQQFCQTGVLRDARLHDLVAVRGGFQFQIELALAWGGTTEQVKMLEPQIAALYDVPPDHVSVEPPKSRSARRAVVTVLTETRAHERQEKWDGRSTYDPQTGTFELGRYADSSTSRYQLHVPYSGACGGVSVGVIGSGKTGTLHVVASEAGQAKLCVECVSAGSCVQCEMRRICSIWMGDPQRQPFGVWRGRADVTAWGPLSCVRMLSWLHAAMRNRADRFGRLEWTDHLGRTNHGKGWFDPAPGTPMLLGIIDEWPIIATDPELSAFAVPLAQDIVTEGRKVGVALKLGLVEADVDLFGDRAILEGLTAFNAVCHRCDHFAKRALGIDGNPADLPPGVHGISYLKGPDKRSGIVQRTKHIREYLRPGETGVDVRAIAERISRDPIHYDDGVLDAIVPLGYTGQGQVLDDEDGWDLSALLPAAETFEPEPEPAGSDTPRATSPASAQDVAAVRHVLDHRSDADLFDLMEATGLSALEVSRAADVLIDDGFAVQQPSGRYAPCH